MNQDTEVQPRAPIVSSVWTQDISTEHILNPPIFLDSLKLQTFISEVEILVHCTMTLRTMLASSAACASTVRIFPPIDQM